MAANIYQRYRDEGLAVIPLKDGRPIVKWSQYFDRLPDHEEVAQWADTGEYALVCGAASGVIALDIDVDDVASEIEQLAGMSPLKKRGSRGFTAFYSYGGEPTTAWSANGVNVAELLSTKHLTTIPPSIHRKTGKLYEWIGTATTFRDLPALAPQFIDAMNQRYPKPQRNQPINYLIGHDKVDLDEVSNMLNYINADSPRDEWVQVGMALRDEFGDAACNLWHDWSSRSPRYRHRDAQSAWRSFSGAGVTIGTIVFLARQGGYVAPAPAVQEYHGKFEVDLSYLITTPARTLKASAPAPIKMTGLVGEIADWITSTAIRPQPVLSLAAALVFAGAMKGHRVRGATDLRTNLMALSMAPTSAGKEHPQKAIDRLADAVGIAVMGRPTSGTGLLTGLAKSNGVSLLTVDEMGRYMGNITTKSAQGYQREIADYMVELFSSASRTFRGRQYADEKSNPQVILQQPHFCCLGSTVPEKMQAACGSGEVIDGFLNRWLVFSVDDRPQKQRGVKSSPPPQALVDKITRWMDDNPIVRDNYTGAPQPAEMRFTPEAWAMLESFDEESMKLLDTVPYPINQLYARSGEHVEKLAMIISDELMMGTPEVEAAITIVRQSNAQIASFATNITDNQHEGDVVFVLDVIKKWPGISRSQLTQRTRRIPHRLRNDILNQLIEAEEVRTVQRGQGVYFDIYTPITLQ